MSPLPTPYLSYLLRLWTSERDGQRIWYASLENPQTGERIGFGSLEHLFDFLRDRPASLHRKDQP